MARIEEILGSDPYLTIKVKNPDELVQKQGGSVGGLAYKVAPDTITQKIYSEMAKQMGTEFSKQGVKAEIKILDGTPSGKKPPAGEFIRGAAVGTVVGGGIVGIGLLFYRLFFKKFIFRGE